MCPRKIEIGQLIKKRREGRNLGLREMARLLKISPSYVVDIEKGKRVPSERVLRELSLELRLDLPQLRALAKKADPIVVETATKSPVTAEKVPELLLLARHFDVHQWNELINDARMISSRNRNGYANGN